MSVTFFAVDNTGNEPTVLRGEAMGEYASLLGQLCAAAVAARAERILWA